MGAQMEEIKDFTVPHLFQRLRAGKKTGIAVFESDQAVKKVYFRDGDVVFASSNLGSDGLGECLLKAERINKQQYEASSELVKKTGKKQGAILVELGFITPRDLVAGVHCQVTNIVVGLFAWQSGRCRFEEGLFPLTDIIPLHMSAGDLILEGVRRLEWQTVRKALPPLNTVLHPATDAAALSQAAAFAQDQKIVLSFIDGKRSIEEICGLSGAGDFNTLKTLYLFLALRMADVGKAQSEEEMELAREAASAATAEPSEVKKMIQKAYDGLDGRDHYQVLGVNQSTTTQEIKKAYFRLAKLYHPDRHFDPEMNDMKNVLEALFARITEAYNTLSQQAKRDEYDLSLIKRLQKVEFGENRTDRAGTAADQFNRGMKEYKAGNFWGALEAFNWASRLDAGNSKYYFYEGLALMQMPRRRHDAEEKLKKAIELDPSRTAYYIELGNLYLKAGLKSRALSMFKEALNWDPDSEKAKEGIIAAGG